MLGISVSFLRLYDIASFLLCFCCLDFAFGTFYTSVALNWLLNVELDSLTPSDVFTEGLPVLNASFPLLLQLP